MNQRRSATVAVRSGRTGPAHSNWVHWATSRLSRWAGGTRSAKAARGHAALLPLEDRLLMSGGAPNYFNGTITLGGDAQHGHALRAWLSTDGKDVVAAVDGRTLSVPVAKVKALKFIGGPFPDVETASEQLKIPATFDGGGGNDSISGGGTTATIRGGGGNDTLVAHGAVNLIDGGAGNDSIVGSTGHDELDGGSGNDTIRSNSTTDTIDGGSGRNVAYARPGDVVVNTTSDKPFTTHYTATALKAVVTVDTDSTIYAGAAVHVNALQSGLGVGNPLTARFRWDFGDAGGAYDQIEGFNAAHIYDRPGTYQVRLTVTNQDGQSSTATAAVTVLSNASMRTIYVAPDGDDRSDGSSPNRPIRSVQRANQLLGSDTKLLFRGGATYRTHAALQVKGYANVEIGMYGYGAKPVLMYDGPRQRADMIVTLYPAKNVTVSDLTFDSIFNGDTNKQGVPYAFRPMGTNIAIRRSTFRNVSYAVDASGQPVGLLVQDNDAPLATGIRAYFVWAQGRDIVIVGNRVANSTREHIVRIGGASRLLVAYNDFTNLDRSRAGDKQDGAKGCIVVQKGTYAYVAHNHVSVGGIGVGPLGGADGLNDKGARFTWAVVEANTMDEAPFHFAPGSTHTVFRNNVMHYDGGAAIIVEKPDAPYGRVVADAEILANTVVNDGTRGNFVKLAGAAQDVSLVDNLYAAPHLVTGQFSTAPVYVSGGDMSSFAQVSHNVWPVPQRQLGWIRHDAVNYVWNNWADARGYVTRADWNKLPKVHGDVFSTTTVGADDAPAEAAGAAHPAVGVAGLFDDFFGHARPADAATAGAIQAFAATAAAPAKRHEKAPHRPASAAKPAPHARHVAHPAHEAPAHHAKHVAHPPKRAKPAKTRPKPKAHAPRVAHAPHAKKAKAAHVRRAAPKPKSKPRKPAARVQKHYPAKPAKKR